MDRFTYKKDFNAPEKDFQLVKFIGYKIIRLKLNQYFWKPCLTII